MIVLHYAPGSPHSAGVRIMLAEKAIEHELRKVDLITFEQHSHEYLAINCQGMVPALRDGGRVLFESFAILRYLDEIHPQPPLGGAHPRFDYIIDKWGKYLETHIAPQLAIVRWAALKGKVPESALPGLDKLLPERAALWRRAIAGFGAEQIAASTRALVVAGERLAADLADGAWICGGDFTLADIALYPHLAQFGALGIPYPRALDDWLARVAARPSVSAIREDIFPLATMGPEPGRWG